MEDPKTKKDLDELESRIDKFVAEYAKKPRKNQADRAWQLLESIQIRKEENRLDIREAVLRSYVATDKFAPQLKTFVWIGERHYRLERKVLDAVVNRIEDTLAQTD